jgi:shikimate dehydrogenase
MSDYLLLGLLGHRLSRSLSPLLHTAALQFCGLQGEYKLFDVQPEAFADGMQDMLDLGIKGFNVTIPYKQNVYKMVHHQTKEAQQAGAINVVKVETNGELYGHNTDVVGFKLAFEEAFNTNLGDKTTLLIGAGGAARAVVVALAALGITKIKVKGRDIEKQRSFIAEMESSLAQTGDVGHQLSLSEYKGHDVSEIGEIGLVVNASPLGFKDEITPAWLTALMDNLDNDCLCFDLVYGKNGSKPLFYRVALERRLTAIDGLSMLIHQARFAFEYWTGISVPAEVLYKALS